MKFIHVSLFLVAAYFIVLAQGDLFHARRHDSEIKNRKGDTIHGKAGIPMVFDHDKKAYMRTGIPELRYPEDVDTTGDSTLREEDEEMDTDQGSETEVSETGDSEDDSDDDEGGDKDNEEGDKDNEEGDKDNDEHDDKDIKNPEELGQGYEKIEDMGSNNKDDDDDEDSKGSKGTDSSDGDIMSKSSDKPDLNGEFPPSADQVKNLPKDEELTAEQANKKMADKRKGYVQFTIRQRFRPDLKYKESAAYKILAGNVAEDVERALRATGVVGDVLFREAKDVGGPPYRSKVQVFLKLQNVGSKKLKRVVDYGLINGMITVPGSFYAS